MRRVMTGMIWLLFALAIFLLGGTLIAACLGYTFKVAGIPDFVVIMGALFIGVVSGCFLLVIYVKRLWIKIIALILSALMLLPMCFVGFILLIFGNLSKNTIVQTVESPGGKYYARVIDSDQGALGGDTIVNVYENKGIDAVIFRIEKKPQRVYLGPWGAFKNMQIHWKDDGCLVINSVEYKIE